MNTFVLFIGKVIDLVEKLQTGIFAGESWSAYLKRLDRLLGGKVENTWWKVENTWWNDGNAWSKCPECCIL